MDKIETINKLVAQWVRIAERDLLTAQQGLEAEEIIAETVCYHLQQTVEKYLKSYLSLSNSLISLFPDTERRRRISVHSQVV